MWCANDTIIMAKTGERLKKGTDQMCHDWKLEVEYEKITKVTKCAHCKASVKKHRFHCDS